MNITALLPLKGCEQPIVAVRLIDGRIGATLRSLCSAFFLEISGQRQRIRRTASLRVALLPVTLDTEGGPQSMDVLLDWCVPIWLAGVNIKSLPPATQPIVLDFQQKVVVLLQHAFDTRPGALSDTPPSIEDQFKQELVLLRKSFASLATDYQDIKERVMALEGGHHTAGISDQRLVYIYQSVFLVNQHQGYDIAKTLKGLAEHFQVKSIHYLSDKDWPAVLQWFESLLEEY